MPCLAIHLAVNKKYLINHKEENENEFLLGTIAPDIDLDNINDYIKGVSASKNSHHFCLNYKTDNVIEYMKKKVDFSLFFASNDINTSFLRGYFLHLLCDYYFFGEYISNQTLAKYSLMDIVNIGYNDYDLLTPILIEKYGLTIPPQIENIISRKGHGKLQILDEATVDRFIEEMANLNLDMEKEKVTRTPLNK